MALKERLSLVKDSQLQVPVLGTALSPTQDQAQDPNFDGWVGWGFLDCLVASLFLQRYECSIVNIEFCRVLHPDVASSEIILNLQHCTKSKCLWISKSFSLPFGLFVFICLFEPLHLDSFACMIEI